MIAQGLLRVAGDCDVDVDIVVRLLQRAIEDQVLVPEPEAEVGEEWLEVGGRVRHRQRAARLRRDLLEIVLVERLGLEPDGEDADVVVLEPVDDRARRRPADLGAVGEEHDRSGASAVGEQLDACDREGVVDVRSLGERRRCRERRLDLGEIARRREAHHRGLVEHDDADLGVRRLLRCKRPPGCHRTRDRARPSCCSTRRSAGSSWRRRPPHRPGQRTASRPDRPFSVTLT